MASLAPSSGCTSDVPLTCRLPNPRPCVANTHLTTDRLQDGAAIFSPISPGEYAQPIIFPDRSLSHTSSSLCPQLNGTFLVGNDGLCNL
ncbi:hypothetical protein BJV78DRAFT_695491 [Lactifluus subvellereus]|nr:hypothetical protein BJV78DRAFT_695491 [Lactifluus subvellereus]